jgi:hypothetical protein
MRMNRCERGGACPSFFDRKIVSNCMIWVNEVFCIDDIPNVWRNIRELDEQYGVPSCTDDRQGETICGSVVPDQAKRGCRRHPRPHAGDLEAGG